MKIGILLCDDTDEKIRYQSGDYPTMFYSFFAGTGHKHTFKIYDARDQIYPERTDECDAYLVTGSRHSCYEQIEWISALKEKIVEYHAKKIKMLGICFGHQIIADSLGGRVENYPGGWGLGNHMFETMVHKPWMEEKKEFVTLGLACQDQVSALPPGAELFLTCDMVKNAGYTLGSNIISIQAHPEMLPAYLIYLIKKRKLDRLISSAQVNAYCASMKIPAHNVLIAHWIINFFNQPTNRRSN